MGEVTQGTMSDNDKGAFSPNENKKPRLQGLRLTTRTAMINRKMVSSIDAAAEIDKQAILSQHRGSRKIFTLSPKRKSRLMLHCMNKMEGWPGRRIFGRLILKSPENVDTATSLNLVEQGKVCDDAASYGLGPEDKLFKCGQCGKVIQAERTACDTKNLGLKAKCGRCKKAFCVQRWKCAWDPKLHDCEQHRYAGIAFRNLLRNQRDLHFIAEPPLRGRSRRCSSGGAAPIGGSAAWAEERLRVVKRDEFAPLPVQIWSFFC